MNIAENKSNSDEECLLDDLTLALSASEDEEYPKTEINNISKDITNNTISTDFNPVINSENKVNNENNSQLKQMDDIALNTNDFEIGIHENSLNFSSDEETNIYRKKSKVISYSEDEEDMVEKTSVGNDLNIEEEIFETENFKGKQIKKISDIIDSESEDDNKTVFPKDDQNILNNVKSEITEYHKKNSKLIESESDEEQFQSNNEENYENINSVENINTSNFAKKPQRATAKVALDAISAIKSETQRMHRENQINVPYHKPRNCSLKEFMARKSQYVLKNIAPQSISKGLPLKMTEQELENYVKYLEEREKESQELFADEDELASFSMPTKSTQEEDNHQLTDVVTHNDNQNEINKSSKVQILSDILIAPAIRKSETPLTPTLNISNLKKLIAEEKDLKNSPTLTGDSNYLIDLESGDMIPSTIQTVQTPKSGVDKLFERFLKSSCYKNRNNSTAESNVTTKILNNSNSLLDDTKFNNSKNDKKPGANYVALKNNLRKKIFESRKTVLDKKIHDFKMENEMVEQICAEEDDEDDYIQHQTDGKQHDIEEDDYKIENLDEEDISAEDMDEILDENEENKCDDADDESNESAEEENLKRNKKLSHRIMQRFDDDSDSDSQECNILNNSTKKQFEINEKQENELLELCSGKFILTQKQSELKASGFVIPTTQLTTQVDESQLEALCSGIFTDKVSESVKDVVFSDEDDDELFKKQPKRSSKSTIVNKISYSDDEEEKNNYDIENDEENTNSKISDINENYEQEEQIDTYIDYDSDENEISVKMTKKDRKIRANDFVEKEAELSESEWGSADEDEKDLDRYDVELGDEDQFDQAKLQSELGKIHMRKMMDEDAREIKKMQELLFEDEETDGLGRQRQFRWRKTENGFDINDNFDGDLENKESVDDDDENEEQWRKMKHEREILLMEKQSIQDNKILLSPLKLNNSNPIDRNNIYSPKFSISKSKKSIDLKKVEIDSPFLISKNNSSEIRGSFLKRDKEILSKVAASLISSKDINNINSNSRDDIGRVKTTTSKHNNFVFTVLSQPPAQQTNKRKLSEISDSYTNNALKKSKLISSTLKKNLIDHLDLTEL